MISTGRSGRARNTSVSAPGQCAAISARARGETSSATASTMAIESTSTSSGLVLRAALDLEDAPHRRRLQRSGAEAVERLGGKGDEPAAAKHGGGVSKRRGRGLHGIDGDHARHVLIPMTSSAGRPADRSPPCADQRGALDGVGGGGRDGGWTDRLPALPPLRTARAQRALGRARSLSATRWARSSTSSASAGGTRPAARRARDRRAPGSGRPGARRSPRPRRRWRPSPPARPWASARWTAARPCR